MIILSRSVLRVADNSKLNQLSPKDIEHVLGIIEKFNLDNFRIPSKQERQYNTLMFKSWANTKWTDYYDIFPTTSVFKKWLLKSLEDSGWDGDNDNHTPTSKNIFKAIQILFNTNERDRDVLQNKLILFGTNKVLKELREKPLREISGKFVQYMPEYENKFIPQKYIIAV